MTKDEIIELAQECGFSIKFYAAQFSGVLECEIADFQFVDLLNAAIAKERERCAKKCDDNALKLGAGLGNTALRVTAMDIRAGRV